MAKQLSFATEPGDCKAGLICYGKITTLQTEAGPVPICTHHLSLLARSATRDEHGESHCSADDWAAVALARLNEDDAALANLLLNGDGHHGKDEVPR